MNTSLQNQNSGKPPEYPETETESKGLTPLWIGRAKLAQFILVIFLHLAPIGKMLYPVQTVLGSSPAAIVLKWAAALAAIAGTYHTVSAASAAIVGLTKYNNNTPVGSPTNNAVVLEGGVFRYRITVSNAGSDHNKDYFNCIPLPPGLTMNTNVGGNGFITNKPSATLVPGVYPVTLYAGNTSFPKPVTYNATITVLPTATPPTITAQPSSQSVSEGESVEFAVVAAGTAPLTYLWYFNSAALPNQTNSTLALSGVTTIQAGSYHVVVKNSAGSATSSAAELVVKVAVPLLLRNPHFENGAFKIDASGQENARCVLWGSNDFAAWTPIVTNAVVGGVAQLGDSTPSRIKRFYQVTVLP